MAQGAVKNSAKPVQAGKSKAQPKKGARVTKPKKAKNSKADKLVKKFSSGMIGRTEKLLGERAGHLELIGKGRTKNKTDEEKKKQAGGSKKFG